MSRQKASMLLVSSILMISVTALGAQAPVANSYKSTANITSVSLATNDCPPGRIPFFVAGNGVDYAGSYSLTEQLCVNPSTFVFSGRFEMRHTEKGFQGTYSGPFNGTFFPSGEVMEIHATWRITKGDGAFTNMIGAGTAKGVASIVDGGPGPGTLVLDGSTHTE